MVRKWSMSKIFISAVKRQQISGSKGSVGIIQHLISERYRVTTRYHFDTEWLCGGCTELDTSMGQFLPILCRQEIRRFNKEENVRHIINYIYS
jgi:hypothetical protein